MDFNKRYGKNGIGFVKEANNGKSKVDVSGYMPTAQLLRSYMLAGKNLVDYRTRQREGLVPDSLDLDPVDYREHIGRGDDLTDVSVKLRQIERLAEEALKEAPPSSSVPAKEETAEAVEKVAEVSPAV